MDISVIKKNEAITMANREKMHKLLKEKGTKINRLALYLLGGRPVTGALMIRFFNILSYRDAIYTLRKKGYDIKSKTITTANGISHELWWLAEYDEEYMLLREEKIFFD